MGGREGREGGEGGREGGEGGREGREGGRGGREGGRGGRESACLTCTYTYLLMYLHVSLKTYLLQVRRQSLCEEQLEGGRGGRETDSERFKQS